MPKEDVANVPTDDQDDVLSLGEAEQEEEAKLLIEQLARRHDVRTKETDAGKSTNGATQEGMPEQLQREYENLKRQNDALMEMVAKMNSTKDQTETADESDDDYEYEVSLPEHLEDAVPALKDLGEHVNSRLRPVEKALRQIQEGFNQWKADFDLWKFGQENPDWKNYKSEIQVLAERHPQLLDSYDGMLALLKLAKAETGEKELRQLREDRTRESRAVLPRLRSGRGVAAERKAESLDEALEQAAARMRREGLL